MNKLYLRGLTLAKINVKCEISHHTALYNSPLLSSAAPSSWGMDRLANRELFPLHSMSSSEDACCSLPKLSTGSLTLVLHIQMMKKNNAWLTVDDHLMNSLFPLARGCMARRLKTLHVLTDLLVCANNLQCNVQCSKIYYSISQTRQTINGSSILITKWSTIKWTINWISGILSRVCLSTLVISYFAELLSNKLSTGFLKMPIWRSNIKASRLLAAVLFRYMWVAVG